MSPSREYRRPVHFRVLGPLEVDAGDGPLPLGGPKQRAVLANLLVRPNEVVPADSLIAEIWGEEPPEKARNTLQTYVSNLRRALGDGRLQGRPPGYVLSIETEELDAHRFDALVRDARRSLPVDPQGAVASLDDALALWRGPALADVADHPSLIAEAARLDELRLEAQEERVDGLLASGASGRAVAELEPLVSAHPLREGFWGQLMLGLYREGRQAEALATFRRAREILADELGIDPSPELERLHARILEHDDGLELRGSALRGYRLLEKIAEGRDGVVFRGIQPHVERDVAVKVFHERVASDPTFARRFDVEAQAAAAIEHPNVAPIIDYWREPGRAYLVSRYLRGGTLAATIERDGPLGRTPALRVVAQAAAALAAIHRQGRAHGNVELTSLFLDLEGNVSLGNPVIGADPPTVERDVEALAELVRRLLPDPPAPLRDQVERIGVGGPASADDFVRAARTEDDPIELASATADVRNPYKGLRPFVEADAADFFGRTALIRDLLSALRSPAAGARFLAVVGPSGCGKSSVVRAGLVPAIRDGALGDTAPTSVAAMSPGADPFGELEAALLQVAVRPLPRLRDRLEEGSRGLLEAIEGLLPTPAEVVLVVDQLEELFTMTTDEHERLAFLELLRVACADPDSRLRVIATLRADHYDRPLQLPRIGELLATRSVAVPPLTADELEQAIHGPAELAGVRLEDGLVAQMIAETIHQPGALPLLQFALTELFERRDGNVLTGSAYRSIGAVAGAVAARAERIYSTADDAGRDAIRQLFLRLVTLGEGREDTRRRVRRSELHGLDVDRAVSDRTIEAFGRHRILTFDREPATREPTVEIAHEALLGGWQRLRSWIDAAREDLRHERSLARAEAEWRANDRDPSFLLRGVRLEIAEGWVAQTGLALGRHHRAFLTASADQRDAEVARERDRGAREQQLERRSNRRMRALVAVFATAALIAGSLTVVATRQTEKASTEARTSRARELAAAAIANLGEDPERSVLLAIEAVELTRAVDGSVLPEAEDALHRSVTASRVVLTLPGIGGPVAWGTELIATTDRDRPGGVDLRDGGSGAVVRRLDAHAGEVTDLRFSPDGSVLATTGVDGVLALWDPTSGERFGAATGEGEASGISFDGDGSSVAAAWPQERTTRVFDATTMRLLTAIRNRPTSKTALSPGGGTIALGRQGVTTVLDLGTGALETRLERPYGADDPAWSPDGRYVATSGIAGPDVWDPTTGRHLFALPGHPYADRIVWSPDSTRLVTGGETAQRVVVWEITPAGPAELFRLSSTETAGGIGGLALSVDGTRAIASSIDGQVAKVWDVSAAGDAEWANIRTVGYYGDVAFLPDGRRVVAADPRGRIRAWDVRTGRATGPVIGPTVQEHAFELSPDGSRLVSASALWNTSTGRRATSTTVYGDWDAQRFSPDGSLLALQDPGAGHDTVIVDAEGRTVATLPGRAGAITWMARFSPDGELVATIGDVDDTTSLISMWDWRRGEVIRTFTTPSARGLTFDPTGRWIATMWGAVSIHDIRTGDEVVALHQDPQASEVAFTPDGRRLAIAGGDGRVRVFETSSGAEVLSLDANEPYPVGRLAISADGTKLAAQGPDGGLVRVWAIDIDDLLEIARSNVTRSLTEQECRRYLHLSSCVP